MASQPLHDAIGIDGPAIVATVGGGGKTTLLFALAQERWAPAAPASRHGFSVLTTTTKFTIPREASELPLALATNPLVRATAIDDAQRRGHAAIIVGSGRGERGRISAVAPDWPRQALALEGVELVGVEADGAAGRAFKAPADHEPVLPEAVTHVLAVVAVTVLGRPLDERAVHRPERVTALTGATAGEPLTPDLIAAVLAHPQGGRKQVPPAAEFAVVIAQAALNEPSAAAIAAACHAAGIERVVAFDAGKKFARSL